MSEDSFRLWLENPITQLLMLEFSYKYFDELTRDNTVLGGIQHGGYRGEYPIHGYRSNPVEETAMNTATSEGALSVLESLMAWAPENLDKPEEEDEI